MNTKQVLIQLGGVTRSNQEQAVAELEQIEGVTIEEVVLEPEYSIDILIIISFKVTWHTDILDLLQAINQVGRYMTILNVEEV